ncbi:hypothetical protein ACZ87_02812 [Candidatus Erwinia dacicola]|uniref:Uncharacterized protein n=1 Tax=Candidatus Erwinia dacicola TaxID=252393 RepID=A0A328TLT6_9GAMM|nr:hypothetical protein ACZ87_02812 [Candidatus Erwinia dacicola]
MVTREAQAACKARNHAAVEQQTDFLGAKSLSFSQTSQKGR